MALSKNVFSFLDKAVPIRRKQISLPMMSMDLLVIEIFILSLEALIRRRSARLPPIEESLERYRRRLASRQSHRR
jgi:hypothetical protein